jgi:hypothetical protein
MEADVGGVGGIIKNARILTNNVRITAIREHGLTSNPAFIARLMVSLREYGDLNEKESTNPISTWALL